MDLFLRQCLREFPFLQCAILKQLVATLAKVKPVSACNTVLVKLASWCDYWLAFLQGSNPTTLSLFTSAIIGEKGWAVVYMNFDQCTKFNACERYYIVSLQNGVHDWALTKRYTQEFADILIVRIILQPASFVRMWLTLLQTAKKYCHWWFERLYWEFWRGNPRATPSACL